MAKPGVNAQSETNALLERENSGRKHALPVQKLLLNDLPEVLTAADVAAYLRGVFGRNAIYELLHAQAIRNRRVGQKYMIPKSALIEFLECRDELPAAGIPR